MTLCSPLSARHTVSEELMMEYPSAGSTSSTIIRSRLQTGPHGDAVFARHLLPNDSAARAAGACQIAELEGASGQGFTGDGIILFNNYRIFRGVLEGNGVIFARRQIDFLGVGLLDGIARGRFQLLSLIHI